MEYWKDATWLTKKVKLFDIKWKNHPFVPGSSLLTTSANHIYEGAQVVCPEYLPNKWQGILATHDHKFVTHSNSFMFAPIHKHHDSVHRIYCRLIFSYHKLCHDDVSPRTLIEEESFLLANAFSASNAGHELSMIFHAVSYIRKNPSIFNRI